MMTTSIISILVCMMCLASMTWAWFSTTINSNSNAIVSADFEAEIKIADTVIPTSDSVGLAKGEYPVTVAQLGSSQNGYCLIYVSGEKYYAGEFGNGSPLSFTLKVVDARNETNKVVTISIVPYWGTYSGDAPTLDFSDPITASEVLNPETLLSNIAELEETTAAEETTSPEETTSAEETTVAEETEAQTDEGIEESTAPDEETTGPTEETTGPTEETTGPEEETTGPEEETTGPEEEATEPTE